ncbi:aminotransferase class IV [Pusillimonas sp. MFBS29]|uniref:aminotransferase class IV n=1 Tax=Pusillimonas sp. MFBS29 TaxID=2886690 RepID=UPI001D12F99C|nr:aminotransferase class IV [Pusillimonas sp. MFBS29]MCC2594922.1 aminotransferase class IV [Pusillimonas sp. MFBS29]
MTAPPNIQLIETMRVEPGGAIPLLAGHIRRLNATCLALEYTSPGMALDTALRQHAAGLDSTKSHRLRLLLSQDGSYTLTSAALPDTPQPVLLAMQAEALQADHHWLRHKTTHRPWYDATQAWLTENPAFFDIVYCNVRDEVCEASRSNVYIQDASGRWLTPPLSCGLLPGVQRQVLLDRGLVAEAVISRRDFLEAPAIRVSNALRGWLDAVLHQDGPAKDIATP